MNVCLYEITSLLNLLSKRVSRLFEVVNDKQDQLESGVNIKSINGNSLLGSGNLVISGSNSNSVYNEIPSGIKNGINSIFNTNFNFFAGSTRLYLNGQRMYLDDDYTETADNELTFTSDCIIHNTDKLLIDYDIN